MCIYIHIYVYMCVYIYIYIYSVSKFSRNMIHIIKYIQWSLKYLNFWMMMSM